MKYFYLIIILFVVASNSVLAQTTEFSNRDDKITIFKGDTIVVSADTAYIINKNRAKWLNYQLDELQNIKKLYGGLNVDHTNLVNEVKVIQKQLNKLVENMKKDSLDLSKDFDTVLIELQSTLEDLKNNNETLKSTNSDLKKQIASLGKIIKDLKKETRGIWWNGISDKLIAFGGGIGIGILIAFAL